jgi:hypothetical protein
MSISKKGIEKIGSSKSVLSLNLLNSFANVLGNSGKVDKGEEMIDIVQKVIESKSKKIELWPVSSNRASEMGHPCERYLVYLRTRGNERVLHDVGLQFVFDEGKVHEKAVLRDLEDAGIEVIEQQRPFEWKKISKRKYYYISVSGLAARKFNDEIGFGYGYKQERLDEICKKYQNIHPSLRAVFPPHPSKDNFPYEKPRSSLPGSHRPVSGSFASAGLPCSSPVPGLWRAAGCRSYRLIPRPGTGGGFPPWPARYARRLWDSSSLR